MHVEAQFDLAFRVLETKRQTMPKEWVADKELALSELQATYYTIKQWQKEEGVCSSN